MFISVLFGFLRTTLFFGWMDFLYDYCFYIFYLQDEYIRFRIYIFFSNYSDSFTIHWLFLPQLVALINHCSKCGMFDGLQMSQPFALWAGAQAGK